MACHLDRNFTFLHQLLTALRSQQNGERTSTPFPLETHQAKIERISHCPKEVQMAFVSKKDLIEKVRPLAEQLARLQDELESLLDQLGDLTDNLDDALDEAED